MRIAEGIDIRDITQTKITGLKRIMISSSTAWRRGRIHTRTNNPDTHVQGLF